MPRVHKSVASKDYPEAGIKKGDTYYKWAFFRQKPQRSKTPPRQSQITASPNLSAAYAADESLQDALGQCTCPSDVMEALNNAAAEGQEVVDAYEETISNLEQAFQGGCPALEEAQEKHDAMEAWISALEEAANEVEQIDLSDHTEDGRDTTDFDSLTEEEKDSALSAAQEIANGVSQDL